MWIQFSKLSFILVGMGWEGGQITHIILYNLENIWKNIIFVIHLLGHINTSSNDKKNNYLNI